MVIIRRPKHEKCMSAALGTKFSALGEEIDTTDLSCVVNVDTNFSSSRLRSALAFEDSAGNFSKEMELGGNMAVAVSGLASCGGVIVTNKECTHAVAGHCGGQLYLREDWCKYINKQLADNGGPYYLIVASGPSDENEDRLTGVAEEYRKALNIKDKDNRIVLFCRYGGIGVANGQVFAQTGPGFKFDDQKPKKKKNKECVIL